MNTKLEFLLQLKDKLLKKVYKIKLKQQGFTYVGNKDNLYYGVNNEDVWQFYYTYGFTMIPITTCEGRLKAKFTYKILLNSNN